MLRKFYDILVSLDFGLWLMAKVTLLLTIGSFVLGPEESARLNSMPLFGWLTQVPFVVGWWLWLAVALMALLGLNTLLCSIHSLCRKGGRAGLLIRLAPHAMHAGFLLIALAHLVSSVGGFKEGLQVGEGMVVGLPDGQVLIERLDAQVGMQGYITNFSATVVDSHGRRGVIRPNEPFFLQGLGLYLKQVELSPVKFGIMEIHREPGAGLALAGALLFIGGNLLVVVRKKENVS
jgi:hypothetical protein